MQASPTSNDSGRNTPGNTTNPNPNQFNLDILDLDIDHQLLATNRVTHRQSQHPNLDTFAAIFPDFDTSTSHVTPTDLDWLLSAPPDTAAAPEVDQFDRDLEQALASFEPSQLNFINNLNTVDFTQQQFSFHRGAPTSLSHPGPLSVITASSESAYGDDRSESHYNPYSPQGSIVNAVNPSHFNPTLFQALENFSADLAAFGLSEPGIDSIQPSQLNRNILNNTAQPSSLNLESLMPSSTASGHSFSSFEESGLSSMTGQSPEGQRLSDDGATDVEREFGKSTNLVNPANYPVVPPQSATDPRKKYQCPSCPRAFARAFNLKTHMATHDPNRLKPHVCNHTGCGRSFSRKHDLGRHLVSIHKDESGLKMTNGVGSSASSTYGVSGHPLPHVNAHANAGRLHQVGSNGAAAHQKGSTTPTASTNFLPNIALGSQNANFDALLGSSFIKSEPKPLTIPGLNSLTNGVGVAAPGVARGWCDACGHGWVGQRRTCKCGGELDSKIKIKT